MTANINSGGAKQSSPIRQSQSYWNCFSDIGTRDGEPCASWSDICISHAAVLFHFGYALQTEGQICHQTGTLHSMALFCVCNTFFCILDDS